ncbi:hypothetical protein LL912_21855 [Niabella sp. CC-SYL272]|uniref:hypothetical protein n=1 Tax=Niabella agricola TaxID=2891571 RepID=UPI001F2F24F7|nr:hypothetical protein [Niabella agricola]MCF3111446.1 hypothetical protein [Niabella agricola]
MKKIISLLLFLFCCCGLYAQNILVTGGCMASTYTLTPSGTYNGKTYYETTGTVAGNTGVAIAVFWMGAPDNVWVLAYDGQPYYSSNKDTPKPPGTTAFTWTATQPAPCPSPGPLSVTGDVALWVTFGAVSAHTTNSSLYVNWQTVTEKNNDHFEIEASADGEHFVSLATIRSKAGNGNSNEPISYEWNIGINALSQMMLPVAAAALFLLMACYRRKNAFLLLSLFTIITGTAVGCKKNHSEITGNTPSFIRIAQIDTDGTKTYSKIVKVVQE